MAIREIRTEGDPCLGRVCRAVEKFDDRLHVLLDDMKDTLHKAQGAGLAAPQVGVLRRVVLVETEPGELLELINPEIVSVSEERQEEMEGCLSVPGEWGITDRPMTVTVRAQDRNGNWFEATGSGLKARCFCHELDHLDGTLYTDNVVRMLDDEDFED